ncbi:MAG: YdbL family protein [Thalassolituus sp.]
MTRIFTLIAALIMSFAASAMELDAAKNMGLVGEQPNGYLGLISAGSPEAAALVVDINAKRKAHYQEIANKQNTQLVNIERIAGEKLIEKAQSSGEFYMDGTGQWQR